ncbi:MAG: putative ABC transporter permease [Clostridia bacterium]|nr:putative ABC transporter permease [Clostridia bacterium]
MAEEISENVIKKDSLEAEKEVKNKKKTLTIMGLSIWRILAYFIIYSVVGYIVETLFGIATKGVWESRQSFLYGPFCGIYGVGATIMVMFLHRYSKKYNSLFLGGFIVGSVVEYLVSLIGEIILHVKWWDYSNMPLNINGRICVYFSFFWGFLAIYLLASLNPKIDKLIDWIKSKFSLKRLKILTLVTTIILFIDCVLTGVAMELFLIRMIAQNDINVPNKEVVIEEYDKIYSNEAVSNFIYKYWGNRKMIRTFPNIKVQDVDGNIVYIDSFLKDIQPYYLKIHEPRKIDITKMQHNLNG